MNIWYKTYLKLLNKYIICMKFLDILQCKFVDNRKLLLHFPIYNKINNVPFWYQEGARSSTDGQIFIKIVSPKCTEVHRLHVLLRHCME